MKARIDNNKMHINNFEYIALYLVELLVQTLYSQHPGKYPPHPCHDAKGNNTPSLDCIKLLGMRAQTERSY